MTTATMDFGDVRQKSGGAVLESSGDPESNISERRQKDDTTEPPRKRGRPRVLLPDMEQALDAIRCYEGKNSRRARVDYSYMTNAMGAIGMGKDERFHWLIRLTDSGANFSPWRQTLLAELGPCGAPFGDEDAARIIQDLAGQLCALTPATPRGVALLRRYRRQLMQKPAPLVDHRDRLADAVGRAIDTYRHTHPDAELSWGDIREAQNDVYGWLPDEEVSKRGNT